jgi:hypothetical protein
MENNFKNPNCFDHVGDQCIEVSVTSSDLNVDSGSSLAFVLNKIMQEISLLKEKVSSVNQSVNSDNIGNLTIADSPMTVTSSTPFKLTVTPGSTNTTVQYDLRDVLLNSKDDVIHVEAFGSQGGVNSRIFRASSSVASFKATPENFPITMSFEVTSLSSEGQKVIKYQKSISNVKSTTDEYPTITDLSKQSLTSQSDVNTAFDRKISSLETKMNQLNSINFNGTTGLSNILSSIQNQIDTVSSKSDSSASQTNTSVNGLVSQIQSQQEKIEEQTKVINDLNGQVNTLKSAVGFGS